jgi:hypothetical protein
MKKLVISIFAYILFLFNSVSCSTPSSLSGYSIEGFTMVGNMIYYKGDPYAILQAVTYSLDGKKLVRELNFKILQTSSQELAECMIKYVHSTCKDCEVELESYIMEEEKSK